MSTSTQSKSAAKHLGDEAARAQLGDKPVAHSHHPRSLRRQLVMPDRVERVVKVDLRVPPLLARLARVALVHALEPTL
eukprot:6183293-Pleurochrysis_carterae.AAC.2